MNSPESAGRPLTAMPSHRTHGSGAFQKLLVSLPVVALLTLSAAGCGGPAAAGPASSSAAAAPKASAPAATPTTTPTQASGLSELAAAQQFFPNLRVNPGEVQNDVLLASYGAVNSLQKVYNSGYLENGSWARNGASMDDLTKMFGQYWTDAYRAKVAKAVADYHSADAATSSAAQKTLMYYMLYTDDPMGTGLKAPADCNQNSTSAPSCIEGGAIKESDFDKEITYQVNHSTGVIYISTTFTEKLRLINNGASGITTMHYDLQFEMVKNPHPGTGPTYLVNDCGGSWTADKWFKQSEDGSN